MRGLRIGSQGQERGNEDGPSVLGFDDLLGEDGEQHGRDQDAYGEEYPGRQMRANIAAKS